MVPRKLLTSLLVLILWPAGTSRAQYIFLDTNGDGICSLADRVSTKEPTAVDIWLRTDANRDGSRAVCASRSPVGLSLFSYMFVLHASEGTVEWGPYTNLQPTMDFRFEEHKSETDFCTGYGGRSILPPGTYKLGTLIVRVTAGEPRIQFASPASLWPWLETCFGSMNPGKEGDNTLKFTEDPSNLGRADYPGDWLDADGTASSTIALAPEVTQRTDPSLRFGVAVAPNPLNPSAVMTVSTTRTGFIHVRLFDVSGRLVRVLLNREGAPAARYAIRLSASMPDRPLASGTYFYRVDAAEGRIEGRIVILK